MSQAIRFQAEPIRSLAFGSIEAGYMGVGTSIDHPSRQFYLVNNTDESVFFSFDGVNDHIFLPSSGFFLDDVASNQTFSQGWYVAEGTRIYVRAESSLPTSGAVYVSIFYGNPS